MPYDQSNHDKSDTWSSKAAGAMLPYILDVFKPSSFVDVGAGYCNWASEARRLGVGDVKAVDGPWTDLGKIKIPRDDFFVRELDAPIDLGRRFDMALTLEVGEHIRTDASKTFVKSLCAASDVVVFGAATPLQGGHLHVNEQWQSFWRDLFAAEGYVLFDILRPHFWANDEIIYYYKQNPFVYVNGGRSDLVDLCHAVSAKTASDALIDAIHPEKYMRMVSYEEVAPKRLARKLPGHVLKIAGKRLRLI